eukprot:826057_1
MRFVFKGNPITFRSENSIRSDSIMLGNKKLAVVKYDRCASFSKDDRSICSEISRRSDTIMLGKKQSQSRLPVLRAHSISLRVFVCHGSKRTLSKSIRTTSGLSAATRQSSQPQYNPSVTRSRSRLMRVYVCHLSTRTLSESTGITSGRWASKRPRPSHSRLSVSRSLSVHLRVFLCHGSNQALSELIGIISGRWAAKRPRAYSLFIPKT